MNIFIAAFPRSGTTFLAKKIVEHFGLYSSPESHFLFHIYRAINNHGAITKKQLSAILEKDFKYRVWDICPELPEILNSDNLLDFYEQLIACYNKVSIDQVRANLTLDHTPENMINQDFIHHFF